MHSQLTSAAILSAIVDGLLTAHPADQARIRRAVDLVSSVERTATVGVFLVYSATTTDTAYRVTNGLCTCPDAARRDPRGCKHAWAVKLYLATERADAENNDPTIAVAREDETIPYELTALALAVLDGEPCEMAELHGDDSAA